MSLQFKKYYFIVYSVEISTLPVSEQLFSPGEHVGQVGQVTGGHGDGVVHGLQVGGGGQVAGAEVVGQVGGGGLVG